MGELVAACVAGLYTLEEGVRLVGARGKMMQGLPAGGAMVSLGAGEKEVEAEVRRYGDAVEIAAVNGPGQTVISGDEWAVQEVAREFEGRGVKTRKLVVSHAFHSRRMDGMKEGFGRVAEGVRYQKPTKEMVSNVSGKGSGEEVRRGEYWVRQAREVVRFWEGVQALKEAGAGTYVELGPKGVLLGLVAGCLEGGEAVLVPSISQ